MFEHIRSDVRHQLRRRAIRTLEGTQQNTPIQEVILHFHTPFSIGKSSKENQIRKTVTADNIGWNYSNPIQTARHIRTSLALLKSFCAEKPNSKTTKAKFDSKDLEIIEAEAVWVEITEFTGCQLIHYWIPDLCRALVACTLI